MKVKCIDSGSYELTLGKEYKVLSESKLFGDSYYQIICDDNSVRGFFASSFEIIKEEVDMKEFLNEDKRQFIYLTDEEKLLIINEKMKGNVEYTNGFGWDEASDYDLTFGYVYRTKPIKKLDIPWQFIKAEFKWAAMDKNGNIFFYGEEPVIVPNRNCFYTTSECESLNNELNIDTTGVDWKTSLTQRPEGV